MYDFGYLLGSAVALVVKVAIPVAIVGLIIFFVVKNKKRK